MYYGFWAAFFVIWAAKQSGKKQTESQTAEIEYHGRVPYSLDIKENARVTATVLKTTVDF